MPPPRSPPRGVLIMDLVRRHTSPPANHPSSLPDWFALASRHGRRPAVFLREKLFDGGIRSAGSSHLSSVGLSGPVGHTVQDEAQLEGRQIDSVGSFAVTSKCARNVTAGEQKLSKILEC